jgi:CRISPR-associated protein Csd2
MSKSQTSSSTASNIINRVIGFLVIEVINSNPNGDPDRDGAPRFRPDELGELGEMTAVCVKRKCRDLVMFKQGPVWKAICSIMKIDPDFFQIFERPDRAFTDTKKYVKEGKVATECWDIRAFGSAFFGDKKDEKENKTAISRGTIQFGMGLSVSPIITTERTITRGMSVQENKTRGMGSLAVKTVDHAIYVMPFFVNPTMAAVNHTTTEDVEVLKHVLPHLFKETASASRPQVNLLHAFWVDHGNELGSCPDHLIIEALTPKRKDDISIPSSSREQYVIPTELPKGFREVYPSVKLTDLVESAAVHKA